MKTSNQIAIDKKCIVNGYLNCRDILGSFETFRENDYKLVHLYQEYCGFQEERQKRHVRHTPLLVTGDAP